MEDETWVMHRNNLVLEHIICLNSVAKKMILNCRRRIEREIKSVLRSYVLGWCIQTTAHPFNINFMKNVKTHLTFQNV
jgi:hypothetical protein